MASEITISGSLAFAKGKSKASMSGTQKADMAGTHFRHDVENIEDSEEEISKGDIATLGYCAFQNIGDTGSIRVGGVTGHYVFNLSPGEYMGPVKWSTNAIFAIGSVGGCKLEILLLEA